jgi:hypothetical protein
MNPRDGEVFVVAKNPRAALSDSTPIRARKGSRVDSFDLFLNCDWAKLIWFYSPLTIRTTNTQTLNFRDWFQYMINNTNKKIMKAISTILYYMWANDCQSYGTDICFWKEKWIGTVPLKESFSNLFN